MNKKITNVRLINKNNEEDVLKLVGVVGFGGWTQEGIYHKPTDDRFWILSETVTDDFHMGHHIMHDITAEIDETWDETFWGWSEYRVEYDVLNEVFEDIEEHVGAVEKSTERKYQIFYEQYNNTDVKKPAYPKVALTGLSWNSADLVGGQEPYVAYTKAEIAELADVTDNTAFIFENGQYVNVLDVQEAYLNEHAVKIYIEKDGRQVYKVEELDNGSFIISTAPQGSMPDAKFMPEMFERLSAEGFSGLKSVNVKE